MVTFSRLTRHNAKRKKGYYNHPELTSNSSDQGYHEDDTTRGTGLGIMWAALSLAIPLVAAVGFNMIFLVIVVALAPIVYRFYTKYMTTAADASGRLDERFTLAERLAYRIDYYFSVVPYIKALTLLFLTAGLIASSGMAIYLTSNDSLSESVWEATAGVGLDWTFVGDDDSGSYRVRAIGVLTNIGGLVVTALLLGIVSDAVSMYLDNLRKGACRVVESNFTLLIGWSNKAIPIMEEIAKANISEGGGVIVVLAERSKEQMERDISGHESKIGAYGTRVVCRHGSPLSPADLEKVSMTQARSVIILSDPHTTDAQNDMRSIRALLSLVSARRHKTFKSAGDEKPMGVTVEVCNMENAPLMSSIDPQVVEPVMANGVIGKLLVQSALQPEVAPVWEALLGFDGCEFYFHHWPDLDFTNFGDVLFRFKEAIPLGIWHQDIDKVEINPPDDREIRQGDRLLVLAEDDDSYHPEPEQLVATKMADDWGAEVTETRRQSSMPRPVKQLLIGWRRDIKTLTEVLNKLLVPGSELHVMSDMPLSERKMVLENDEEPEAVPNVKILHHLGSSTSLKDLEKLDLTSFSSIMVSTVGYKENLSVEDRDSQTIVTLLAVHDILQKLDCKSVVVVGEIHDPRSRQTILDTRMADAIIATDDLVSKSLAMVSEDRNVNRIFEDLFNAQGCEVQVLEASMYVRDGETLSFFEVMQRLRADRCIAIGYQRGEEIVLNPPMKSAPFRWASGDRIVAICTIARRLSVGE